MRLFSPFPEESTMPRRSTIRYFPSRTAYYTQIDGVQNHLATGPDDAPDGPTYKAACRKFAALVCDARADQSQDENPAGLILARFQQHTEAHRRASTVRLYKKLFRPFAQVCGELRVAELRHRHVYEFLERMRSGKEGHSWGDGTCRIFIANLQAAFNWASLPGVSLVTANPLRGIERPGPRSRSGDCLVSSEDHRRLCAAARPHLRDLIVCLEATGARPAELLAAQAADWIDEKGALLYRRDAVRSQGRFAHKASKRKDRMLFFSGEALEIMRRLVGSYPSGPLFRTRFGRPWTASGWRSSFEKLCERVGVEGVCLYSYRHTFATNWLLAGKSIDRLAALLGNTVPVLRQHYAHLLADTEGLRADLESFRASQIPPASPGPKLHRPGEGAA
jgi:integrase